jgi:oligopeptide/dipeptide ABC transporter ATP-binding protein
MINDILQVQHLRTHFFTRNGVVKAVDDISFALGKGECLCLVGESGCGKTAAALSILRLVDSPPGRILGGKILFHGEDLLKSADDKLRRIRGNKIAMIFQDPQVALNPVFTVGDQIEEQIKLHLKLNNKSARERTIGLMEQVGIPCAKERIKDYPHQFSGGMKQRVMIQILEIFRELKRKSNMSTLFITHDLGTVAEIADRIIVMYGGRIAEEGTTTDIFDHPKHPYTLGLINCLPSLENRHDRLTPIPGTIPSLINPPEGCIFYPRCERHMPVCIQKQPGEVSISGNHMVTCHLYEKDILK